MKQHNSIPQHIQLELLKKQYDVYCIIHFAIWFLKRNTVIRTEEIERVLSVVKNEMISFLYYEIWRVVLMNKIQIRKS